MKNKIVDKKIMFLFLMMIIMIVVMIKFLNNQEGKLEKNPELGVDNRIEILNKKQERINYFLDNSSGLFSQGLQEIFEKLDLVSYIELPLPDNASFNSYPFGALPDVN